jgi:D-lactate dehydrogenase
MDLRCGHADQFPRGHWPRSGLSRLPQEDAMRIAVYSTSSWDRATFREANSTHGHDLRFLEAKLDEATAELAQGAGAACLFVNDKADAPVLERLAAAGVGVLALRSAGFDHVDLAAAKALGMTVARVPGYSPHSVAEHAVALIMMLDRKLYRAWNRVREGNFSLEGLVGFELRAKTVGVVGTGRIGAATAGIMLGFGCRVIAFDLAPDPGLVARGVTYVALDALLAASDIVTLHLPLNDSTRRVIDARAIARLKPGAMLINTGRGGLIDTRAVVDGLKAARIGALGLDVYEREAELFFADRSGEAIQDDLFARLLTFPNVVITAHQAFFTREALGEIAATTLGNISAIESRQACANLL